ncbi:LpqB family beta-propeller domain-containing protein [Streptosporangium soli]|nr:LpqB family beta-propeller domain-containing protein [Streptosporangium sp. KLBMP 9127]
MLNSDGVPGPVPGQAGQPDGGHVQHAVSGNQANVAALNAGGDAVEVAPLADGGQWQRWITGKDLTMPSWDRYDTVWAADRLGARSSRVFRHNGKQQTRIAAPGLETVGVRSLRVARDGVRIAALVDDDLGTHVRVGTIIQGHDTRVANLQTLFTAAEGQKIVDLAWRDATTLLVLTGSKSGQELLAISVTDGTTESFKADARITSIAALEDRVLAGAQDTEEDRRELLQWEPVKGTWIPLIKDPATMPILPLG